MLRRKFVAILATMVPSGCLRLVGGEGSSTETQENTAFTTSQGTHSPTNTAATTSTSTVESSESPTSDSESINYPLGLDENGVSPILADQHTNALMDTTFTASITKNNLTHTHRRVTDLQAAGGAFLIHLDQPDGTSDIFASSNEQLWRTKHNGDWVYGVLEEEWGWNRATAGEMIRRFFEAASFDIPEKTVENGDVRYYIEASEIEEAQPLLREFEADKIQEISVTAEVRPDGIVPMFTAEIVFIQEDTEILYRQALEISNIGKTNFSKPSWVSTSRSQERTISASLRDDGMGVTYQHNGGPPAIAGSYVGLDSPTEFASGDDTSTLDTAFTQGDSLVVYLDGDHIAHSRQGIPNDAETKGIPTEGWTWMGIGLNNYYDSGIDEIS